MISEQTKARVAAIEKLRQAGESESAIARTLGVHRRRVMTLAGTRQDWEKARAAERRAAALLEPPADPAQAGKPAPSSPDRGGQRATRGEQGRTSRGTYGKKRKGPTGRIGRMPGARYAGDAVYLRVADQTLVEPDDSWYDEDGQMVLPPGIVPGHVVASAEVDIGDMVARVEKFRDGNEHAYAVHGRNDDGALIYSELRCDRCSFRAMRPSALEAHQRTHR